MCTGRHPYISAPNVAKIELICTAIGQRVENVVYIRSGLEWDETALTALAEAAIVGWSSEMSAQMSTSVELVLVRATDMGSEDSFGVEIAPATTTTGSRASLILPNSVTVATKFATGYTGRSRRGRAYWIGLTENMVTGNQLEPTEATSITDSWAGFFGDIYAAMPGTQHVIVSYCGDGEWRDSALITAVTNYSTDNNIDSQRRRLNGRGL